MDDAVREFLATKPDAGSVDDPVSERRATILVGSDEIARRFTAPGPEDVRAQDVAVQGPDGPLRLRVYRPDTDEPHGIHVFLHGGAFWLGSTDELVVDITCRERAATGCVVVAVDYRHAPEHPFPAAVEDGYTALRWAHQHAPELVADDEPALSVGGVSAGATLAAAVALAARDRGGPPLRLQLLEVPLLDLTLGTMHDSGVSDDYGITRAEMAICTELYLADPQDATHPLASPLLAPDVAGLPDAVVLTAELDPLRDDGLRYTERLEAAGVPVTHVRFAGMVHGGIVLTAGWEPARAWQRHVADALRAAHATVPAGGEISRHAIT